MHSFKSTALILAAGICIAGSPAMAAPSIGMPSVVAISAQTYLNVIQTLETNGYQVTGLKTTLLGRMKIRAQNRKHIREVVVSRSTGEVLSDRILRTFAAGSNETKTQRQNASSGSSSGGGISAGVDAGGVSVGASAGDGGVGVDANVGGVSVSVGLGG